MTHTITLDRHPEIDLPSMFVATCAYCGWSSAILSPNETEARECAAEAHSPNGLAEALYADVLGALRASWPDAFMADLGGGCLAIEIPARTGHLWITDRDDNLPWDRADHSGWMVGVYLNSDDLDPYRMPTTDDSSLGGLLDMLSREAAFLPDPLPLLARVTS